METSDPARPSSSTALALRSGDSTIQRIVRLGVLRSGRVDVVPRWADHAIRQIRTISLAVVRNSPGVFSVGGGRSRCRCVCPERLPKRNTNPSRWVMLAAIYARAARAASKATSPTCLAKKSRTLQSRAWQPDTADWSDADRKRLIGRKRARGVAPLLRGTGECLANNPQLVRPGPDYVVEMNQRDFLANEAFFRSLWGGGQRPVFAPSRARHHLALLAALSGLDARGAGVRRAGIAKAARQCFVGERHTERQLKGFLLDRNFFAHIPQTDVWAF